MESVIPVFRFNTCIMYNMLAYLMAFFIEIKHVTVTQTETIQTDDKFENLKFAMYFFNKDIILFDIS